MKKLQIIRDLLAKIVEDIDAGNSNLSEDQYNDIIEQISFFSNANTKYSKYQACKYLGISRATFDNKVREGLIPLGKKQQGFKELFWLKSDLDKYKNCNMSKALIRRMLVETGYASSLSEAGDLYTGKMSKYYEPTAKFPLEDTINIILKILIWAYF